ncbi:MAG: WD40 repeat domain-containing protein [Cyanobacteriota bacterium]|nr:WD40 repeat domain-containing protein [Cyanobacteriota bacterium]
MESETRKTLFSILFGLIVLGAVAGVGLWISPPPRTNETVTEQPETPPPPTTPPTEQGETVALENTLELEGLSNVVAISPLGNILASASDARKIKLWNLDTGTELRSFSFEDREDISRVTSIAISKDERTLAIGWLGNDAIDVWYLELDGTEPSQTLPGQNYNATSIAFDPEGNVLVRGNSNGTIQVWNLIQGTSRNAQFSEGEVSHRVTSLAISPDGQTFASGSNDGKIKIWNLETGEALHSNLKEDSGSVTSLTISPKGQTPLVSSSDKTITIWNLNSGEPKKRLTGHSSEIGSVATSENGQLLASGDNDGIVKIWDLNTEELLETYKLLDYSGESINLAISSNGQTIVVGRDLITIKIWRIPELDNK